MKYKFLLLLICAFFTITSCSLFKKSQTTTKKIANQSTVDLLVDSVKFANLEFNTLQIRFNIDFKSKEKDISAGGVMRIVKDKAIWLTLSPGLGIEAARALITPDSIKLINRLNSTYYLADYNYIKKLFNIDMDYNTIQSILLNELFFYKSTESNIQLSNYVVTPVLDKYILSSGIISENDSTLNKSFLQKYVISSQTKKITNYYLLEPLAGRELTVNYTNYSLTGSKNFPGEIDIFLKILKSDEFIKSNLVYKKISVNEDLKINFDIPGDYVKAN